MPATLDPPTDLLDAASALEPERFEILVNDLLRVRAGRTAKTIGADEAGLLARINSGLPPEVWDGYRRLRERHHQGTLSPADHAELTRLTDAVEGYQAERAAALVELATLRGQPLPQLMDSLGITGPASE